MPFYYLLFINLLDSTWWGGRTQHGIRSFYNRRNYWVDTWQ